jgi:hypothetical protein
MATEAFVLKADAHICGNCKKWDKLFEDTGICRYKKFLGIDYNKADRNDSCSISLREGVKFK